jgi:hypothetical protein
MLCTDTIEKIPLVFLCGDRDQLICHARHRTHNKVFLFNYEYVVFCHTYQYESSLSSANLTVSGVTFTSLIHVGR